ncbi:hypothetical protein BDW74DRAFT_7566 [Aspergillus multicolor]|uniref:uncharacterized protein n=1 Tax=Aspergillus multicolor TaxID=41759 RepID=UPI003CCCCDC8
MEDMSSTVLSFSEQLLTSGVLEAYPHLAVSLRDTMKTIVSLASEAGSGDGSGNGSGSVTPAPAPVPADEPTRLHLSSDSSSSSSFSSFPETETSTIPHGSLGLTLSTSSAHTLGNAGFTHIPNLKEPGISSIELPDFIQMLSLTALKQSYMALHDPSIGPDQLQRPFGLILSILSRADLVSYVKADLDAQANHRHLDGWDNIVPFFQLGGAGTHHLGPSSLQGRNAHLASHRHRDCCMVTDPLALATFDLRQQLEGEWFDLHDLEGFLADADVLLLLRADERQRPKVRAVDLTKPRPNSNLRPVVDVAGFIPELIRRGVCLGRSPGFQRGDVERALQLSIIS